MNNMILEYFSFVEIFLLNCIIMGKYNVTVF